MMLVSLTSVVRTKLMILFLGMLIAVEGCAHGQLSSIYEAIEGYQEQSGERVDVLLCCGDFQAVRHKADLQLLKCPAKYRQLGDFPLYCSG
jgi:lariat debranching enzyme